MKIIVGHTNTDLDCIGSMVLARYLFPDHTPVRSRFIHPVARNLYNLYQYHLDFKAIRELKGARIERMVVVDTRSYSRLQEYFQLIVDFAGEIEVFDHHLDDSADLKEAVIHQRSCGANTTLLGLELVERNITVSRDDATIALLGLYADTGRFTHTNVQPSDFQVASYLLDCGASLKVLEELLRSLRDDQQINLFHTLLNSLVRRNINGHSVLLSYLELEGQRPGLSAVVEKVFEVEDADALFSVFALKKQRQSLIIGRSRKDTIELNRLLEAYGGGGHPQAASALLKGQIGEQVMSTLQMYLDRTMAPAVTAGEIMSDHVEVIDAGWGLLEASIFLERIKHTGAPVTDRDGKIVGFMTLRDIMKGRSAGGMRSAVTAYMTRKVITAGRQTTIREIQNLMFENDIGHLPVVEKDRLIGIVTRSDLIRFLETRQEENRRALIKVGEELHEEAQAAEP